MSIKTTEPVKQDKPYMFLATLRLGDTSFTSIVGHELRSLADAALNLETCRFPKSVRAELERVIYAEINKPFCTINYSKPFSVPWGNSTAEIAFDCVEVVG